MLVCVFHHSALCFVFCWPSLTPLATLPGVFPAVLLGRELPTLLVLLVSCQNPAPRCSLRCYLNDLARRQLQAHVDLGLATANTKPCFACVG